MRLVEQWSELKKHILGNKWVKGDLLATYKQIFKLFDQDLSKKLRAVEKSATKAAGGDAKAVANFGATLDAAIATIGEYRAAVRLIENGFLKKHPASVQGFTYMNRILESIEADLQNAVAGLGLAARDVLVSQFPVAYRVTLKTVAGKSLSDVSNWIVMWNDHAGGRWANPQQIEPQMFRVIVETQDFAKIKASINHTMMSGHDGLESWSSGVLVDEPL